MLIKELTFIRLNIKVIYSPTLFEAHELRIDMTKSK